MTQHTADTYSRTAKILLDDGTSPSLQDAVDRIAGWTIQIVIGEDAVGPGHQAAALTAIAAATRAAGHVPVAIPATAQATPSTVAWHRGTYAQAITAAGGEIIDIALLTDTHPTLTLGRTGAVPGAITLQITWNGWVAHVDPDGGRLVEAGTMPLAPAAAAALAIAETFGYLTARPDAGLRTRTLSLWHPETPEPLTDPGPDLAYLPTGAWLVGLGHLGQAYAWCWGLLPYANPADCLLVLQDDDIVTEANHSTGLLVTVSNLAQPKTRVVAGSLEAIGFRTRLVERRLAPGQTPDATEPSLALIGVDNVRARRAITSCRWTLAVDAGLGSGPTDYTAISIKTFPAAGDSSAVVAWAREPADHGERAASAAAYQRAMATGADRCGVVQLAGRSAAASFVGVLAACLSLAEPLRRLHGAQGSATLTLDVIRPQLPRRQTADPIERISFLRVSTASTTP